MSNKPRELVVPKSLIHAEASIGSSVFDITTENCDAVQLLGMSEVFHALGMQALAANQSQMRQHDAPVANGAPVERMS